MILHLVYPSIIPGGGGILSNNVQDVIEEINNNKVNKSGDTLSGDLAIDEPSSTTDRGQSTIIIGNNTSQGTVGNSQGCIRIFGINTGYTQIWDDRNSTSNINVVLPGQSGTLALEGTVSNISMTNDTGGAEANKATMYYTGKIGIITGQFRCQNETREKISFDLPSGWRFGYGGIVLRDVSNGNLVSAWTTENYIQTYLHTGTMTVGNVISFSISTYRTT